MHVERAYCNLNQHLYVPLSHCLGRKGVCKNWCGRTEHCYTQAEVSRLQSRFLLSFSFQCEWLHVEYRISSMVSVGAELPAPPSQCRRQPRGAAWSSLRGWWSHFACPAPPLCSLPASWQVHTSLMLSRETTRHAQDPEHSPGTASFWHSVIQ